MCSKLYCSRHSCVRNCFRCIYVAIIIIRNSILVMDRNAHVIFCSESVQCLLYQKIFERFRHFQRAVVLSSQILSQNDITTPSWGKPYPLRPKTDGILGIPQITETALTMSTDPHICQGQGGSFGLCWGQSGTWIIGHYFLEIRVGIQKIRHT